jgi:twinkle protein
VKPDTSKFRPLDPAQIAFFASRGISKATLDRNGVMCADAYFAPLGGHAPAVAFPYKRDGEVVNVKFRSEKKHFTQVRGAEKVLYGLDDVVGQADIIIVEGEMDKLALEEAGEERTKTGGEGRRWKEADEADAGLEARNGTQHSPRTPRPLPGFTNVVSVPDGAPRDVKEGALPDPEEDVKFSYLWASRGVLDMAARIIIATDSDGPGQALSEELARRLGRERCWRVKWPVTEADAAAGGKAPPLKDANEVLMAGGPDALKAAVEGAEPYPIRGLFRCVDVQFWGCVRDRRVAACYPALARGRAHQGRRARGGLRSCGREGREAGRCVRALPSPIHRISHPCAPLPTAQLCGL